MKKIIISGILLSMFLSLFGQIQSDSIQVKKRLGPVFQQNGRNLTPRQLLDITQTNQEAYAEMKTANTNYIVSLIFQAPGGFLIGYPLGTALAGGDPNWTLAAVGAGLVAVSIPFISAYNKHAKNAVEIYNRGLRYSSLPIPEMKIGLTNYGIALKLSF